MTTAQVVVRGRWFPADVMIAGEDRAWHRCYVLAADSLAIFREVSETPSWESLIDWASTTVPESARDARNGFSVHTTAGLVVVTLGPGCRCGPLGHWRGPLWAIGDQS